MIKDGMIETNSDDAVLKLAIESEEKGEYYLFNVDDIYDSVKEDIKPYKRGEIDDHNITQTQIEDSRKEKGKSFEKVAPKEVGVLDMVIAFDTTGSMAEYIGAVRKEVSDLIPRLFADNEDLRLGIVAFGDYCDMKNAKEFGDAYRQYKGRTKRVIPFVW